jgi:nucleoside 2-deoxyribosyltransferase
MESITMTTLNEHERINVYVASSWRNGFYPDVIKALQEMPSAMLPMNLYDFRNPPERSGFAWSEIDPDWKLWSFKEYSKALEHPVAQAGYDSDMSHVESADVVILVLPAGASAHSEAGYAAGKGKMVYVLFPPDRSLWEPELMYKMYYRCFQTVAEVINDIHFMKPKILDDKLTQKAKAEALALSGESVKIDRGVAWIRGEPVDVETLAAQGRAMLNDPDRIPADDAVSILEKRKAAGAEPEPRDHAPRDGMAS